MISLLLLFCPDMLDLDKRRQVEEMQLKNMILLQKYLDKKYKLIYEASFISQIFRHESSPATSVNRLTSAVECLGKCKELRQIFAQD